MINIARQIKTLCEEFALVAVGAVVVAVAVAPGIAEVAAIGAGVGAIAGGFRRGIGAAALTVGAVGAGFAGGLAGNHYFAEPDATLGNAGRFITGSLAERDDNNSFPQQAAADFGKVNMRWTIGTLMVAWSGMKGAANVVATNVEKTGIAKDVKTAWWNFTHSIP